jgi:hypothetical protein
MPEKPGAAPSAMAMAPAAGEGVIPTYVDLSGTTLKRISSSLISVSNIVVGDRAYSGIAKLLDNNSLVADSFWESKKVESYGEKIARLEKENKRLNTRVAVVTKQRNDARAQAVGAAPAVAMPAKSVSSGFKGTARLGGWKAEGQAMVQEDATQKFAKYSIPVSQTGETLFSFTAKAQKDGWVGYGLHFFASDEKRAGRYGFGKSLLVWLTRDPSYYRSDATYLQIYQSYNDVMMIQKASVAIPEAIDATLKIDTYYNPSTQVVIVMINGDKKLEYKVQNGPTSGDKIALRTLHGPVQFSNVEVKAK